MMVGKIKATDEQVVEAYERLGSVWKAAKELGMCGQSIHERITKLDAIKHINVFTKEDEEYLSERYVLYRDAGHLQDLADEMGRTKQFICRKARELELTAPNHSHYGFSHGFSDMPIGVAAPIWERFKRSPEGVSDFCRNNHYNIQSFVDAMNRFFPEEYDIVIESKGRRDTARAKGIDFEFDVQKELKSVGYTALRTPASKSPADVYAFKYGQMLFVQCRTSGAMCPKDWNDFFDYSKSVNAKPIIASQNSDGTIEYNEIIGWKIPGDNHSPQPMMPWSPCAMSRTTHTNATHQ